MIEGLRQGFSFKEMLISSDLSDKVEAALGVKPKIEVHSLIEGETKTRVYRLIISAKKAQEAKMVLTTDWDDTLEKYSLRKTAYHQDLSRLFLDELGQNELNQEMLMNFFLLVNEISRYLPIDGTHPEIYSPYLELLSESCFLQILRTDPKHFINIVKRLSSNKVALRNLIKNKILPLLPKPLLENEHVKAKSKHYFREKEELALEINFKQKPNEVIDEIWELFKRKMTQSNLSTRDIENMDLNNEDVYWVVSTFGSANFQIEKVLAGLKEIKQNGQRLPDEIIVIIQGRKDTFLRHLFHDLLDIFGKTIIYLDDSERQLDSFKETDGVHLFKAIRGGAKRAREESKHQTINLDEESLTDLISRFGVS